MTLGESMVQLNPTTPGPLRYARTFERHAAGSESNVAIGAVRMGLEAMWVSRVGKDEFGQYLLQTFRGEGVDVSRVVIDESAPTGVYFLQRDFPVSGHSSVIYYRAGSAASRLQPEDVDQEVLGRADALHLSGITLALSQSARRTAFLTAQTARQAEKLVSFDTNLRLKLWSPEDARPHVSEMIGLTDVLFIGERDYLHLWGRTPRIPDSLEDLQQQGPQWVILKRGERGAVALLNGQLIDQAAFSVRVEDKTGAGDALAAAVLAGILQGRDLTHTMRVAVAAAAIVCTVRGDFEAIPTWSQAESWLEGGPVVLR